MKVTIQNVCISIHKIDEPDFIGLIWMDIKESLRLTGADLCNLQ